MVTNGLKLIWSVILSKFLFSTYNTNSSIIFVNLLKLKKLGVIRAYFITQKSVEKSLKLSLRFADNRVMSCRVTNIKHWAFYNLNSSPLSTFLHGFNLYKLIYYFFLKMGLKKSLILSLFYLLRWVYLSCVFSFLIYVLFNHWLHPHILSSFFVSPDIFDKNKYRMFFELQWPHLQA